MNFNSFTIKIISNVIRVIGIIGAGSIKIVIGLIWIGSSFTCLGVAAKSFFGKAYLPIRQKNNFIDARFFSFLSAVFNIAWCDINYYVIKTDTSNCFFGVILWINLVLMVASLVFCLFGSEISRIVDRKRIEEK